MSQHEREPWVPSPSPFACVKDPKPRAMLESQFLIFYALGVESTDDDEAEWAWEQTRTLIGGVGLLEHEDWWRACSWARGVRQRAARAVLA